MENNDDRIYYMATVIKLISVTVGPTYEGDIEQLEQLEQHERCDSALLRVESGVILLQDRFRLTLNK